MLDVGAELSEDGLYRYRLWRRWDVGPSVLWIMLNPSTAGAAEDDPTIRRCIGFAKSWGCSAIEVVNLFALRATDPRVLRTTTLDPYGPLNFSTLHNALEYGAHKHRIAAWGAAGGKLVLWKARRFREHFGHYRIECLGRTRGGQPRHPLMLPRNTVREAYTEWRK